MPPDSRRTRPATSLERAERAAAKLEAVHRQLADGVAALQTDADWRRWLRFSARIRGYSFSNRLLIMLQAPDATLVAGYQAWKAMGRQVNRGEQGIAILAPVVRRGTSTADGAGGDPEYDLPPAARDDPPGQVDETRPRGVVGFRLAHVFDVPQTSGNDLPVDQRVPDLPPDRLWHALTALLHERGFTVTRAHRGGEDGYTDYQTRVVAVREDLDAGHAVYVLAHEVGHVLLHDPGEFGGLSTRGCRGRREVEAESVAFLVTAHLGMDTPTASFPYVADWAREANPEDPAQAVIQTGQRVIAAATIVVDHVEAQLDAPSDGLAPQLAARVTQGRADAAELAAQSTVLADTITANPASELVPAPEPVPAQQFTLFRSAAPAAHSPDGSEIDPARLYAASAAAAAFFARRLAHHAPAMQYLREHGIETAAGPRMPWQIGYAPTRGWSFLNYLRSGHAGGFTDNELVTAGLARRHTSGRVFATFRDRVIFPVHDEDNRIVGFTARNLAATGPKYLNTPETAIYHKSSLLFGLGPMLRYPPPGQGTPLTIVVEGAADAIAVQRMAKAVAHLPGAPPVYPVATCGTRLTSEHLALLARTLPPDSHLALAFDGDSPGREALARAYPAALAWAGQRFGITLSDGQDPATLLAAAPDPATAFHTLIAAMRPLALIRLEHTLDRLFELGRVTDPATYPQDLVRACEAIAELFIDDPDNYLKLAETAASRLRVDPTAVVRGVIQSWDAHDGSTARALAPDRPDNPDAADHPQLSTPDPAGPPQAEQDQTAGPSPPSIATGQASGQGRRRWQADAAVAYTDPVTGRRAWAVADGVGDEPWAADAAQTAAQVASYVAARTTSAAGIEAARAALNVFYNGHPAGQDGDAAIVVATAHDLDDATSFDVAWAGDARAYTLRDGQLVQVSVDHTAAQQWRDEGRAVSPDSPLDHLLTSSVRRGPIGHAILDAPCPSLLLCTDGIHRQVGPTHLTAALRPVRDPQATAARLVAAADSAGNDNATVLLLHAAPVPGTAGNPAQLVQLSSPAPVPASMGPPSTARVAGANATQPHQMSIELPAGGMNRLNVRPGHRR